MLVPLQIPGGPELLVLLLIAFLVFGVPIALVALGLVVYRNRDGRVEELEGRIEELERELDRDRGDGDND